MKIWDGQKMADLVTHQAKLKKELHDVSDSLHQEYNSDAWGGDDTAAKTEKFSRDQLRHAQLTRELEVCNSEINSLEQFRPSTVKAKKNAALTRFLQRGHNGLEADEIKQQNDYENDDAMVMVGPGYERFVITPETDEFSQAMPGMNPQQSTASDANSGNVLAPSTTRPSVIDALKYYGGISRMAYNFSTGDGNELRLPYHDEVSVSGELLTAQDTTVKKQDLANFEYANFGAHTMSSRSISITREMLQDSIIDIAGFANARVVRRMGRGWDTEFMTEGTRPVNKNTAKTNAPEPTGMLGLLTCALIKANKSGTTKKIVHADLVNAIYDVDRAYREGGEGGEGGLGAEMGGRTGFLISDEIEKVLTTLTDSDGRPLWLPSWASSVGPTVRQATILGYPYEVGSNLPALAANARSWLFGNFSYFGIRTVAAIEIFRFQDSRTMQNNTIEILGFSRRYSRPMVKGSSGADPDNSGKFAYLGIPQIVLQQSK